MLSTQILEILFGEGTTRDQVATAAQVAQVRVQDLVRSACDVALEHGDISDKSAAYSAACREMGLSG
jgi:hypothetical protein